MPLGDRVAGTRALAIMTLSAAQVTLTHSRGGRRARQSCATGALPGAAGRHGRSSVEAPAETAPGRCRRSGSSPRRRPRAKLVESGRLRCSCAEGRVRRSCAERSGASRIVCARVRAERARRVVCGASAQSGRGGSSAARPRGAGESGPLRRIRAERGESGRLRCPCASRGWSGRAGSSAAAVPRGAGRVGSSTARSGASRVGSGRLRRSRAGSGRLRRSRASRVGSGRGRCPCGRGRYRRRDLRNVG